MKNLKVSLEVSHRILLYANNLKSLSKNNKKNFASVLLLIERRFKYLNILSIIFHITAAAAAAAATAVNKRLL